ncbi:hypothetical protein ACU8L5_07970 [Rhizobium leguminosarum]|jgi:hypothetical protein|uniref:hypothetical protein n=1 Tax=Rhizobium TaxID=379 RepID=UPI000376B858|nr:hypothetical protein [Rhizobium leguminosarum]MBB4331662.1 hypothetical protein [Rhizobium leguminosarum]MBB4345492.1 hypothetical protein [Rhizobium leguminosarum]MBB4357059.1 hypothetical protein [Rhizobium leguminosarum]MBB4389868.1 hypothetical protein [Rhizobium leguminosarum]MBB4470027.1 hypothetical protein [Rhizobium leguminosarum]
MVDFKRGGYRWQGVELLAFSRRVPTNAVAIMRGTGVYLVSSLLIVPLARRSPLVH